MSVKPTQQMLPFGEVTVADVSPPNRPSRYDPSDEALAAYERLEDWLLDARGQPTTEPAEQALRYLARALLDVPPKRGYTQAAEDALEVLKLRNGKTEGDDIPDGNAPASDNFQTDVDELLDHLHEGLFTDRGQPR